MQCVRPVINGLELYEQTIGGPEKDQPEYRPLYCLQGPDGRVMSRWQLTDEERKLIAAGADIYLTLWTGSSNYPPTLIAVATPNADPDIVKQDMRLDDYMELRWLQESVLRATEALNSASEAFRAKLEKINPPQVQGQVS